MPQVAAMAAAAVKFLASAAVAAAAGQATLGQTVAVAAMKAVSAVATQAAFQAIQGRPRAEGSATAFRLDTDAGIPFAFGRVGTGGVLAYRKGFGATNRYQAMVSTLSGAGPIKSFISFAGDDEETTFGVNDVATDGEHEDAMWLQRKLGAQPETAHTSPTGLELSATAPGWTSNHKMSGRATAMWTLFENSKMSEFKGGIPKPLHVIEGKYGWDPRLDSTWPGGSGSCRLNNPSTWVWIDEGCIAALNWAIGMWEGSDGEAIPTYGVPYVSKLVGGIGSSLAGIDVDSFIVGANNADAKNWKVAAYPTTKDDKYAVLANLLQASGCVPSRLGGRISCICPTEEAASIITVTAADTAGPIEVVLGQSRLERRNTALPRHWSEDHNWEMIQLAPVSDVDWRTADGGMTRTMTADYPYVPDHDQAAQLAYYDLANAREAITGTIPFKPHMRRIEPGDCFTFEEPGFLLDGVKVRALKRSFDPMSGIASITFRQETDAKHDDAMTVIGIAPDPAGEVVVPDPVTPPPELFTITLVGSSVKIDWRNPTDGDFTRTRVRRGTTNVFSSATEILNRIGALGAVETYTDAAPGSGVKYYWIQAEGLDPSNVSDPIAPTPPSVTVP